MLRAVEKEFNFCCAHRLYHLPEDHQCSNIHGHNYRVLVKLIQDKYIYDPVEESMVVDFGILKEFQKHLDLEFDHKLVLSSQDSKLDALKKLTKVKVVTFPTTCENFCVYFGEVIEQFIRFHNIPNIKSVKITIYESDKNSAQLKFNM